MDCIYRTLTAGVALVVTVLLAEVSGAHAQDVEPRAYANTPVGLNFLLAGYAYAEGGVGIDPTIPLKDAKVQTHTAVLAYVRSLDVWGKSGKFDVVLPYAWVSGSATFEGQPQQRDVSGFGDPRFRFSVNLYGAPALSLQEFADYKQDVIIGASLQVSAPGGQYDSRYCPNSSPLEEVPLARKPLHVSLRAAGEANSPFIKTRKAERLDCRAPVGRSQ